MHSPTPWTFIVEDGGAAEIIRAADGTTVHYDTTYYPSGLATADAEHIVACVNRVAELEAALRVSMTALCSWRSYMENTSDGATKPSRDTASRLYDQCSDAIAACDRLGIEPTLSPEPQD